MILVTGGAGFIGSVLARELNKMGREDLIIVDRLRDTEKWKNLRKLKYEDFIHADDFFKPEYSSVLSKITEVYHMGACSSTTETNVDYLMKNNWEFSKNLFIHCSHNNIKICYASSAATYGDGENGYNDESDLDTLRPLNAYGYSKQYFDQWVKMQKRHPDYWYGIKFFNVFGPNEYHKGSMRSVVHQAWQQIHQNGNVKLFESYKDGIADGEQKRDFVYVKDCVKAMIRLMGQEDSKLSGIYNMGTGKARSFNELVRAVFKALEKSENIEYIKMPDSLKNQYQYFTEAENQKLLNALPEFKFRELEDSVRDYVLENLENKDQFH